MRNASWPTVDRRTQTTIVEAFDTEYDNPTEDTQTHSPRPKWERPFLWTMGALACIMLLAFIRLQFVNLSAPRPYKTENRSATAPATRLTQTQAQAQK